MTRGLAALAVLLYHLTGLGRTHGAGPYLGGVFARGNGGVDVFFVLSGFLMAHLHGADIARPSRVRLFFLKRTLRIYPVYWLVLSGVLATYLINPALGAPADRQPGALLRSILLLPQAAGAMPVLRPAWTLVHEMGFYAMFAACIALPRRLSCLFVLGWLGCVAWQVVRPGAICGPLAAYVAPINLEFLAGIAAARGAAHLPRAAGLVSLGLGAALLVWALGPWHADTPGWRRFIDVGAPAALALMGMATLERGRPWACPPLLLGLGDASFSLYMLQAPALGALTRILAAQGVLLDAWALHGVGLATVLCAALFHRCVERPLTRWAMQRAGLAK